MYVEFFGEVYELLLVYGKQLVYNYELPGHRRQLVNIKLFIYDKDGRKFVYLLHSYNYTIIHYTFYTVL